MSRHCPTAASACYRGQLTSLLRRSIVKADLYYRQVLRFLANIHSSKTDSNGSRGDNDHSVPILAKFDRGFNNEAED